MSESYTRPNWLEVAPMNAQTRREYYVYLITRLCSMVSEEQMKEAVEAALKGVSEDRP